MYNKERQKQTGGNLNIYKILFFIYNNSIPVYISTLCAYYFINYKNNNNNNNKIIKSLEIFTWMDFQFCVAAKYLNIFYQKKN